MKFSEGIKSNPRIVVFFICLLISSIFWLFTILSKDYSQTEKYPVAYKNAPASRPISKELPDTLLITFEGTGMNLLAHHWFSVPGKIEVDLGHMRFGEGENENIGILNLNLQQGQIAEQLNTGPLKISRIFPAQVNCRFEIPYTRILPVKPLLQLDFTDQYNLSGEIFFSPKKIMVRGSRPEIEKLDTIYTEVVSLKKLHTGGNYLIPLAIPEACKTIVLPCKNALVSIPVEKFTEAEVDCPIEVAGVRFPYNIKLFPEKVTVSCQIPLSKFRNVKPSDFRVVADAGNINGKTSSPLLSLSILKSPAFSRNCRMEPNAVEFVLTKQQLP
jgi:hypothetical protein